MNFYDLIDADELEKIAIFNEDYDSIETALKDLKVLGKDIEHIEVLLEDFLPLISLVRVNFDEKVVDKIENLLLEVFDEIKAIYSGDDFKESLDLIGKCYEALTDKEYGTAELYYKKLSVLYSNLDKEFKRLIFRPCLDISKKIEKYESLINRY